MTDFFIVTCQINDSNGKRIRVPATTQEFKTHDDASYYLRSVSSSRVPIVEQRERFTDEEIAAVFWEYLKKEPGYKDRRQTAWGSKTKTGLVAIIKRLAMGGES